MDLTHCVFIDRRTRDGGTDFTDLPFDDLNELKRVAEAALGIGYVVSANISKKTSELEGIPWWGKHVFSLERTRGVQGAYVNEEILEEI